MDSFYLREVRSGGGASTQHAPLPEEDHLRGIPDLPHPHPHGQALLHQDGAGGCGVWNALQSKEMDL